MPFTWEKRKFRLEKQMFRAIPYEKLQKICTVIWGDVILIFSAGLDIMCSGSFSHHFKFYSFLFTISTPEVCLNGKHPWLTWLES